MSDSEDVVRALRERLTALERESARTRERLTVLERESAEMAGRLAALDHRDVAPSNGRPRAVTTDCAETSPSAPTMALFRSLFRGRDDVFPRRWENATTGKSGYAPACRHEWVRGVCGKPAVKCGECPNQAFIPVTDGILQHLSGAETPDQATARS